MNTVGERSGEVLTSLRAQRVVAKQAAREKRREDNSIHGVTRLLYLRPHACGLLKHKVASLIVEPRYGRMVTMSSLTRHAIITQEHKSSRTWLDN